MPEWCECPSLHLTAVLSAFIAENEDVQSVWSSVPHGTSLDERAPLRHNFNAFNLPLQAMHCGAQHSAPPPPPPPKCPNPSNPPLPWVQVLLRRQTPGSEGVTDSKQSCITGGRVVVLAVSVLVTPAPTFSRSERVHASNHRMSCHVLPVNSSN